MKIRNWEIENKMYRSMVAWLSTNSGTNDKCIRDFNSAVLFIIIVPIRSDCYAAFIFSEFRDYPHISCSSDWACASTSSISCSWRGHSYRSHGSSLLIFPNSGTILISVVAVTERVRPHLPYLALGVVILTALMDLLCSFFSTFAGFACYGVFSGVLTMSYLILRSVSLQVRV